MSAAIAVTGAGAVIEHSQEPRDLPPGSALVIGPDGSIPLGHLPEAVRGRAARAERVTQLVLAAAGRALAAAGLDAAAPETRAGIVLGTAFGCFLTNAAYQRRLAAEGPPGASPRLFAATVSNAAAGELAIAYRLAGPAVTVTAGGASGLAALGEAIELIRAGRADVVVAGGVDALGGALADWLDAAGLEFGTPPAEAGAVLVLERPGRTRPEIGRLAGHAAGFEPDPLGPAAGEGLARAIDAACADAGLSPREIAVVVSGAPPPLAALEDRALAAMPGDRRLSPKIVFGETLGAAGPLALLAALAEAEPGVPVLVLDACPTGHVAALVAWAPEAR
ncbi:MAG: hypothetical protein E6J68_00570 [Deltaproteobacteria bacterium]|nr:MAG: hypothetical protein E6J68_00570 [Deltaproteobacteria bacterium]